MGTAECWLRERSAVWRCAGLQSTAAGGGNPMQARCKCTLLLLLIPYNGP